MTRKHEDREIANARSAIRKLNAARGKAESLITDCHRSLATEKAKLASLLTETETSENKKYLKAAKKAYRLGIKAWEASVAAYQNDIDMYKAEVDAILKRVPEARQDH